MLEEMKSIIAEQLNCSEEQINESTSFKENLERTLSICLSW